VPRERLRAGIRRGLPFGLAVFAISISFGVLARPLMGWVAPIVMSILVFSGAAQFGALAVLKAGGSTGAAPALGDPNALGLDALFPAFFVALLFEEVRGRRRLAAAGGGAAIALVLTPLVPAGLPILAAAAAAVAASRMRA
jgi:predicted branched-subunit amino acid permease